MNKVVTLWLSYKAVTLFITFSYKKKIYIYILPKMLFISLTLTLTLLDTLRLALTWNRDEKMKLDPIFSIIWHQSEWFPPKSRQFAHEWASCVFLATQVCCSSIQWGNYATGKECYGKPCLLQGCPVGNNLSWERCSPLECPAKPNSHIHHYWQDFGCNRSVWCQMISEKIMKIRWKLKDEK